MGGGSGRRRKREKATELAIKKTLWRTPQRSRLQGSAPHDSGGWATCGSCCCRDLPPAPSQAGKCWAGGQGNTLALTAGSFLAGIISLAALLSRLAAPQPGHQPMPQLQACRARPESSITFPARVLPNACISFTKHPRTPCSTRLSPGDTSNSSNPENWDAGNLGAGVGVGNTCTML